MNKERDDMILRNSREFRVLKVIWFLWNFQKLKKIKFYKEITAEAKYKILSRKVNRVDLLGREGNCQESRLFHCLWVDF
jgi:hypothetical protein